MHDARLRVRQLPVGGCRQPQEKDAFALTYLLDETDLPWKPRRSHIPARIVRWYHLPVPREKIIDYAKPRWPARLMRIRRTLEPGPGRTEQTQEIGEFAGEYEVKAAAGRYR